MVVNRDSTKRNREIIHWVGWVRKRDDINSGAVKWEVSTRHAGKGAQMKWKDRSLFSIVLEVLVSAIRQEKKERKK